MVSKVVLMLKLKLEVASTTNTAAAENLLEMPVLYLLVTPTYYFLCGNTFYFALSGR